MGDGDYSVEGWAYLMGKMEEGGRTFETNGEM